MTEPGSDFYVKATPPKLGDPALDPPMTVRVHPDDDPRSPDARRVIRTARPLPQDAWAMVTGVGPFVWHRHHEVADWSVQHPVVYGTVFRHAAAADAREQTSGQLAGDMGVDAFKGGAR